MPNVSNEIRIHRFGCQKTRKKNKDVVITWAIIIIIILIIDEIDLQIKNNVSFFIFPLSVLPMNKTFDCLICTECTFVLTFYLKLSKFELIFKYRTMNAIVVIYKCGQPPNDSRGKYDLVLPIFFVVNLIGINRFNRIVIAKLQWNSWNHFVLHIFDLWLSALQSFNFE